MAVFYAGSVKKCVQNWILEDLQLKFGRRDNSPQCQSGATIKDSETTKFPPNKRKENQYHTRAHSRSLLYTLIRISHQQVILTSYYFRRIIKLTETQIFNARNASICLKAIHFIFGISLKSWALDIIRMLICGILWSKLLNIVFEQICLFHCLIILFSLIIFLRYVTVNVRLSSYQVS